MKFKNFFQRRNKEIFRQKINLIKHKELQQRIFHSRVLFMSACMCFFFNFFNMSTNTVAQSDNGWEI